MPKPREVYMHILCPDRAYLAPLKLMGPVVHPMKVNKKAVIRMLTYGCTVYEVDLKTQSTVKLSLTNINDEHRFESTPEAEPKSEQVPAPVPMTHSEGIPNLVPAVPETDESKKQVVEDTTGKSESADTSSETRPSVTETGTTQNGNDQSKEKDLVESYELTINENGKVDETKIDWSKFNKEERRALRNRITAINAEANASATI